MHKRSNGKKHCPAPEPPVRSGIVAQQCFKKADESSAVLGFRCGPNDAIFLPVVTAKKVSLLFFSWSGRWNASLLPNLHPACSQRWIQCYGCFVHKDEPEIVSDDLFFDSSNRSADSALAPFSCKWPRSCFGRRYRYPFRLSKSRNRLSLKSMALSSPTGHVSGHLSKW
jgi:hypothetical protein